MTVELTPPVKKQKTGGRKKGTRNKSTASFRATLDSLGFDVAEEAVKLFKVEMTLDQRLKLLDFIATYSHQKPKPIDTPLVPPAPAPSPVATTPPVEDLTKMSSEDIAKVIKLKRDS